MEQGGLAENRHDRGLRLEQQAHLVVGFHGGGLLAGGPKGGEPGVFEFFPPGLGKKLDVLGIAARPAALDVMDAEGIELLGDAEFVQHRKVDALTLGAIPQGRVIDFNLWFHKLPAITDGYYL